MLFSSLLWITTNIHHPVTPSYFTSLGLPNHIFGTSFAMMVFTSFLTAPLWGSFGDRHSRIKILIYSTILYGLAQIGFANVTSLGGILFFRGVAGIGNGGFSGGLMAAIVDTSSIENRSVAMANYSALLSVSMAAGYLIGGVLGFLPPETVIIIQGISMILIGIGFKYIVGETNEHNRVNKDSKVKFIWDILIDAKKSKGEFNSWILIFLSITLFSFIASGSNGNAFNYYLKEQLNLKPIVNGVWKAVTGITGLIANMTINVWIFKKKNIKRSLVGLLALSSISAIMILLNRSLYPFMLWSLLIFTLNTIQVPILQNFAVQGSSADVGFMSGIYNAIRALGEVIGSISAGFAYNVSSQMPFVISAIALFAAFLFSILGINSESKTAN